MISSEAPTNVSIVSANMPPTTGTKWSTAYFAVRRDTPSAAAAPRDCRVVTEMNTVKPTPSVQLAPVLKSEDRRLIFMRGDRWFRMAVTPAANASGSVTDRTSAVIVPPAATTAGWKNAAPAVPPTAASRVKSSGNSACIKSAIRATASWASRMCLRAVSFPAIRQFGCWGPAATT